MAQRGVIHYITRPTDVLRLDYGVHQDSSPEADNFSVIIFSSRSRSTNNAVSDEDEHLSSGFDPHQIQAELLQLEDEASQVSDELARIEEAVSRMEADCRVAEDECLSHITDDESSSVADIDSPIVEESTTTDDGESQREEVIAYFSSASAPNQDDPLSHRYTIVLNNLHFIKQYSGRFAGTWLDPWLERRDDNEDTYYRALYIYKLVEESLVINGVETRFMNRRSGGEGVMGEFEFWIGDERCEMIDTWVEEEEMLFASKEVTVDDSVF